MLLSAVSALVVAQSSSEMPEVLMNNPVSGICTKVESAVFYYYMISCSLVDIYRRFGGTCFLHLRDVMTTDLKLYAVGRKYE